MEALLGLGLGLGLDAPAARNPQCNSVAELQDQLRALIASKTSQNRAEHVSETFALPLHIVFDVPVSDVDSPALENIDPSLGGTRPAAASPPVTNGAQPSRQIKAIDTLLNQPQNDPVAQMSVARLLVDQIGAVDRSNWAFRQVSRNAQGWTFAYHCKDSWQSWNRQVAKHPARTAIGEWSAKDGQDPVNMSRPAFDCRGTVKIAFVGSNRSIDVTYEHTCLHTTVAKLADLLAPPPLPAPARKENPPKTPKVPKTPRAPKDSTTPRSTGKKRRQTNGDETGEGSQPKKKRRKNSKADGAPAESIRAAGTAGAASAQGEAFAPAANPEFELNLPEGEAERRRKVAFDLLMAGGIDPATLQEDQMNIFANQDPKHQQESLAMLQKYGAKRLRIVHPEKNCTASPASNKATPPKIPVSPAFTQHHRTPKACIWDPAVSQEIV